MLKQRIEKTYQKFPYRADFENGRTNIGGIDLTKEPECIDEIVELSNLPKAKEAIYQLNVQNTAFMTLGCAFGELSTFIGGYIEICLRPEIDNSLIDIMRLDELFFQHLAKNYNQRMVDYMERALMSWEVHFATVDQSDPLPIVAIFVGAQSYQDLDLTVELLIQRLHQDFLYLTMS